MQAVKDFGNSAKKVLWNNWVEGLGVSPYAKMIGAVAVDLVALAGVNYMFPGSIAKALAFAPTGYYAVGVAALLAAGYATVRLTSAAVSAVYNNHANYPRTRNSTILALAAQTLAYAWAPANAALTTLVNFVAGMPVVSSTIASVASVLPVTALPVVGFLATTVLAAAVIGGGLWVAGRLDALVGGRISVLAQKTSDAAKNAGAAIGGALRRGKKSTVADEKESAELMKAAELEFVVTNAAGETVVLGTDVAHVAVKPFLALATLDAQNKAIAGGYDIDDGSHVTIRKKA